MSERRLETVVVDRQGVQEVLSQLFDPPGRVGPSSPLLDSTCKLEDLHRRLLVREVRPVPRGLAEPGVERLDRRPRTPDPSGEPQWQDLAVDPMAVLVEHGMLLESARGPLPNVAEIVAGEPIRGSWWGHRRSHEI